MDIKLKRWEEDDRYTIGGYWVEGKPSEDAMNALEAFAKTDVGYAFLAKYAQEGLKIGSVVFNKAGEYADITLNLNEYENDYGKALGSFTMTENSDGLSFNIAYSSKVSDKRPVEDIALTMGHEAFIHADISDDAIVSGYRNRRSDPDGYKALRAEYAKNSSLRGDIDHKAYIRGDKRYANFNVYVNQLKNNNSKKAGIINTLKNKHDEIYRKFK